MPPDAPSFDDVVTAHRRIRGVARFTPLVESLTLSREVGGEVLLKLETLQPTGSFKVRGAASRILALSDEESQRGVVTASTGNHGRAVAHVASIRGTPAVVCISDNVPTGKVDALRTLGCEVVVGGDSQTDALVAAHRLVEQRRMTLVHPFDDPHVIAGQGTIGLEIAAQAPMVTTVVVPVSGGGLAAGIALAVRACLPDARVVGVSMRRGAAMAASLAAGRPVEPAEERTLADSLQGGIGEANTWTFPLVRDLVDEIVLVDEAAIWAAMRFALQEHRMIVEGGAAVGIAALRSGMVTVDGATAVVVSGANAELEQVAALASAGPAPTS